MVEPLSRRRPNWGPPGPTVNTPEGSVEAGPQPVTQGKSHVTRLNPHVPQGPRTADPSRPDCSEVSPAGRAVCGQVQPVGRSPETALPQAGKELGMRGQCSQGSGRKVNPQRHWWVHQKGAPHMFHARAACIASNHPSSQRRPDGHTVLPRGTSTGLSCGSRTLSPTARPAQGPRLTAPPNPGHSVTLMNSG